MKNLRGGKPNRYGTALRKNKSNKGNGAIAVNWDGNKPNCIQYIHPSFIEPVLPMTIPPEHALTCPTCGQTIDCRDLGQVLAHRQYNELTGKYECHEPVDVPYSSSKKVGDSVEWMKGKKRIDLN